MFPRYPGHGRRTQEEQPGGVRVLCAVAPFAFLIVGVSAMNRVAGPWAGLGCLVLAVVGALLNLGVFFFTSDRKSEVTGRPIPSKSGGLVVVLLGDGSVLWGFYQLAPNNGTGWWWVLCGMIALVLGILITVAVASRESQNALY
jgi:hypothetical protein